MLDWSIKTERDKEIARWLAERRALLRGQTAQTMRRVLTDAVTYGRTQQLSGGAGNPQVRSGRLRRAFRMRLGVRQGVIRGRLGFLGRGIGYAVVQEHGATITPKNAKFLTIPLPGAFTRTGRMSQRSRRALVQRSNTFIWGGMLLERRGPRTVVPIFALVKRVVVPRRPTLSPTWGRYRPALLQRLEQATHGLFSSTRATVTRENP